MIKALIADDHPIMRKGLKLFLICNMDIEVEEVASGYEAIEYVRSHPNDLDIMILDITMPGMDGPETLRVLKESFPELPVLILSAYSEDQYALCALRSGANGYLMKTSATEELVEAVQRIVDGGMYLSPSIAHRVTSQLQGEELPHHILSEREFEVMRKIASGKSLTQISRELNLSIKTVSTYRGRILEKMKLRDNADITQYALRHGLLSDAV